jgi:hypothetical protein
MQFVRAVSHDILGFSGRVLNTTASVGASGPFEVAVYLFNRHVLPFPNEELCVPRSLEEANIPTLAELHHRVAGGTAILDTLARLLTDAESADGKDRRVIVLTDGWRRASILAFSIA